ncbi:hypothetical protein QYE76_041916 [Lolium multiflorum]|uniref:DUF4283 domain-containing protein n=1 Tax=Lolium multiflorum TaxID=4521 RepID=A0AAD8TG77_LOLMU|nr:hypothetical protein QYE76_041916 [Lolium multiflorum]
MTQIKSQARDAIQNSRNISKRLSAVRARLKRLIEEEGKVPPDPGRLIKIEAPIVAGYGRSDGEVEILKTAEVVEGLMRPFTGLNPQSNIQVVGINVPISVAEEEGKIAHSNLVHTSPSPSVHGRCLCIGTMSTSGNKAGEEVRKSSEQPAGMREEAFRKRAGKEVAGSSSGVKNIIVVNMSGARKEMRARFLAVGLFLSVLLANSQQVIDHMKRVWKIRGKMEANQVQAAEGQRKFILEFTEEGDRDHVVRAGPWQYRGDAFLVEGLQVGADPATALFTHVPMWVQFRNIPFYLLTKKLARELGEQVGSLVNIDNNARGNICDKILRARVQLPLYMALQKEIMLMDEITEKQVEVQIRYEIIPNFCLFCGFIGHMEARCDAPVEDRKLCFSQELRVRPVHFEDPRTWFLPEAMGQIIEQASSSTLWRAPAPATWTAPWTGVMPAAGSPRTKANAQGVEKMAEDVARLCVLDHTATAHGEGNGDGDSNNHDNATTPDNNNAVMAPVKEATAANNMNMLKENGGVVDTSNLHHYFVS